MWKTFLKLSYFEQLNAVQKIAFIYSSSEFTKVVNISKQLVRVSSNIVFLFTRLVTPFILFQLTQFKIAWQIALAHCKLSLLYICFTYLKFINATSTVYDVSNICFTISTTKDLSFSSDIVSTIRSSSDSSSKSDS